MSNREFLKRQVEIGRENEKCNHCGGDIRLQIMSQQQRDMLEKVIRGERKTNDR